ncbi:MAG TPA: MJ0042-type zinc finger domain-containing protein [Marinospirillum sp.]|uniref:MJ0042-type zinc finger domain-containing protein n=1 Tax=Marinospirillum sp. TaxID=2183934 RepID=UPI002B46D611|nr:MJ0042-type zinc finger domain-containing protein [Marinospirillum sp.]HKM14352.1 MJ0042-type zinc finger domain-containing protein [Marinospirillum sp.]
MNTTNSVKQAECPHCHSIFSVSEEEIALALGAVRCGECMKIFNASYHLIDVPHTIPISTAEKELESMILAANLANTSNKKANIPLPLITIPTLQEPAEKVDFLSNSTNVDASEIDTEEIIEKAKTKKMAAPFIAGLFFLLIAISVAGWLFVNQAPPIAYTFTDVRLTSSSGNSKKIDVYFKISNVTEQTLPLPNLTIQLLNLSSQPVSSEVVMAVDLKPTFSELAASASHEMQASVDRPTIFVQGAHIEVHLNNTKL